MNPLEQRMGYTFRNNRLLDEALTHPSLAYEARRPNFDNQRLEFLGDAVLQLAFTEHLFHAFESFPEGRLTKLRSRLVSREALCGYARRLDLGSSLMLGRGEDASGGRTRASSLADAFEALVGAVYLDAGLPQAVEFIFRCCAPELAEVAREPEERNPKGALQEMLQGPESPGPTYITTSESGPDHAKQFTVRVEWQGRELGSGSGASKKQAEILAAADALERLRDGDVATGQG